MANEPQENRNTEPLASEIYQDLKGTIKFLKILVVILIAALVLTNLYHIYEWSQFDTVVVDSGEGSGNANYVQGDNSGGIYNGEGIGPQTEEGTGEGSAG